MRMVEGGLDGRDISGILVGFSGDENRNGRVEQVRIE